MIMDNPFDSLEEAQMRIMAQWEYEGKLDEPWTVQTVMGLHEEMMRYAPGGPAAVFPWSS